MALESVPAEPGSAEPDFIILRGERVDDSHLHEAAELGQFPALAAAVVGTPPEHRGTPPVGQRVREDIRAGHELIAVAGQIITPEVVQRARLADALDVLNVASQQTDEQFGGRRTWEDRERRLCCQLCPCGLSRWSGPRPRQAQSCQQSRSLVSCSACGGG
ncbi:hypothetical protein ACFP81_03015 [Deinococcus lacus]|uniref:Uncharacterized protein n=1 Tax=Deinococcus lacus TaxID=392561 RepID=A0ABW1YA20_9DEIO